MNIEGKENTKHNNNIIFSLFRFVESLLIIISNVSNKNPKRLSSSMADVIFCAGMGTVVQNSRRPG